MALSVLGACSKNYKFSNFRLKYSAFKHSLVASKKTAINVLKVNIMMIHLMILSKILKLPLHKIKRQIKVIKIVHVTKSRVKPNNIEAREAQRCNGWQNRLVACNDGHTYEPGIYLTRIRQNPQGSQLPREGSQNFLAEQTPRGPKFR